MAEKISTTAPRAYPLWLPCSLSPPERQQHTAVLYLVGIGGRFPSLVKHPTFGRIPVLALQYLEFAIGRCGGGKIGCKRPVPLLPVSLPRSGWYPACVLWQRWAQQGQMHWSSQCQSYHAAAPSSHDSRRYQNDCCCVRLPACTRLLRFIDGNLMANGATTKPRPLSPSTTAVEGVSCTTRMAGSRVHRCTSQRRIYPPTWQHHDYRHPEGRPIVVLSRLWRRRLPGNRSL